MISASSSYVKIEERERKMLSLHLLIRMKKLVLLFLACFFFGFCSFFKSRVAPYPSGVMFPVDKAGEIVYKGKIIDLVENVEGKLFLSTREGSVYCLNALNRKILWTFEASETLESPPFLGTERIYVYDRNNTLYCLSRAGELIWEKKGKEKITSGIAEIKERIYFGTEEGGFFASDTANGKELWRFQAGEAIRSTPVFAGGKIVFGCDDHSLYLLSEEGNLLDQIKVKDKIQSTPYVEKNYIYFGADDHYFYCFNFKKGKRKWRVKTGGKIFTSPVSVGKRILFLCWNNVLYCLNKKNGNILWWKIIPSRSYYHLEISGEKVVVTSLSSLLVCFDIETGEKVGDFNTGSEVKSNPLWLDPYLLVSIYDNEKDKGRLLFLTKRIKVSLKSSKGSPQKIGEEIIFTASAVGFYMAKYEFYLKEGEKREVVQEKSEKNSWIWLPEKEGNFVVGVNVVDKKESKEAEIPFMIEKD